MIIGKSLTDSWQSSSGPAGWTESRILSIADLSLASTGSVKRLAPFIFGHSNNEDAKEHRDIINGCDRLFHMENVLLKKVRLAPYECSDAMTFEVIIYKGQKAFGSNILIIGYARVSTEEQNLALQTLALEAAGCVRIFTDHGVSGAKVTRPGLERALRRLKPGGKLVVWRLDRLGRSLTHLVKVLDHLGRRHIRFQSLTESIDTTSSGGRLIFHMMAALAEFERALISERTRAGMAAARLQGKSLGRQPSLTPEQCFEALLLREKNQWSTREVAAHYGVHPRTLRRRVACLKGKRPANPS
ncbi:recombinase family protein [Candidatus Burkholderia verschuerenii]|uniref:recombinase family protein n=1 Tax=Candidatus Burkholderia verschuerenii TaxID=242163 RepID=UPI002FC31B37